MHFSTPTQLNAIVASVLFVCLGFSGPVGYAQGINGPGQGQQRSEGSTTGTRPEKDESGKTPLTDDEAKKLVANAIESLYLGIAAEDRSARLKAVQSLLPQEKHIACLFGKTYGKVGFDVIKPRCDAMIARVDDVVSQMNRDGRFIRCDLEALEMPTNLERRALSALMQDICPETFRFKASIQTIKTRSSSGSYFVIDREVVFIRDGELIQIARRIHSSR